TEIIDMTQTAVAGWRKVLTVLDTPVEVPERADGGVVFRPHGAPELVVDHVTFAYHGRDAVLRDVNVTIPPTTRVAVVGPTGSGKTTMAKLLTRLADPTEGRITIDGVDLRDLSFA